MTIFTGHLNILCFLPFFKRKGKERCRRAGKVEEVEAAEL